MRAIAFRSPLRTIRQGVHIFAQHAMIFFYLLQYLLLARKFVQVTSKCGKNKKVAHEAIAECVTDVLPHFDVFCDLLLDKRTATWNLFVLYAR